jgi:hypothetical protein
VKIITVSINPPPSLLLTASESSVCNTSGGGSTVALTGNPSGGVFSGTNVSGAKFTPATAGTFQPVYSYTNSATGCSNTATVKITVQNCTGLTSNSSLSNIAIFPNPAAAGKFVIKNLSGTNKIELFNLLGSLVMTRNCDTEDCVVDMSSLTSGHYFVKITDSKGATRTVKIVNQN